MRLTEAMADKIGYKVPDSDVRVKQTVVSASVAKRSTSVNRGRQTEEIDNKIVEMTREKESLVAQHAVEMKEVC